MPEQSLSPIITLKEMLSGQMRDRKSIDDFLIRLGEYLDTLQDEDYEHVVRTLQLIVDHAHRVKQKKSASYHTSRRTGVTIV